MIDFDLDRLGDVWRQRPDPAELEHLKRSADAVRRRARWAQLIDIVAALVVAAVVLLLVLSNPKADTLLVGGAAILMLLGTQVRSRRLRQEELRSLTGSTEQMLDQSISRTQATLKRSRLHLLGFAPAIALGFLFAYVVDDRAAGGLRQLTSVPMARIAMVVGVALFVTAMTVYLIGTIRTTRRELERLIALREAYRGEQDSNMPE
jgi:hypothetical protein